MDVHPNRVASQPCPAFIQERYILTRYATHTGIRSTVADWSKHSVKRWDIFQKFAFAPGSGCFTV
jgi:hypothetical protein